MDQLSERNAKVVVGLPFLVLEQGRKALREALQNLDIGEIPLRKPSRGHNPQLRLDSSKVLRTVTDDHDGLLHRTPCDLSRAVDQFACVQLSRTRDAKEARGRVRARLGASQGEVGVVFGRTTTCQPNWEQHRGTVKDVAGATYACAPSLRAMNGRFDQSFSTAGSASPSSTPNHRSTSGPLHRQLALRFACPLRRAPLLPCMVEVDDANERPERHVCYRRVSLCPSPVATLRNDHKIRT